MDEQYISLFTLRKQKIWKWLFVGGLVWKILPIPPLSTIIAKLHTLKQSKDKGIHFSFKKDHLLKSYITFTSYLTNYSYLTNGDSEKK